MEAFAETSEYLAIYLAASILAVPVLKRLGLGTAPGYLLAGMLIGPWGLALVREAAHIDQFTGFTVLVFLFLLGLELEQKQLRRQFKSIVTAGGMQFLLAAIIFVTITRLFGEIWFEALAVALALSVSTSTLVNPLLTSSRLRRSDAGLVGLSILRFQSLALIPLLIIIPLLGFGSPLEEADGPWRIVKALFLFALLLVTGRYVLRYVFRYIASVQLPEIFTAFTLFVFVCVLLLTKSIGLSMGLGALLCGMLLADSEFKKEIQLDLAPYGGLFIGLFFISIGLAVDFGLFLQRPSETLGLLLVLLLVKAGTFYAIAAYTKLPLLERPWFSTVLSQGGELSFVLLVLGAAEHAITARLAALLTIVVAFSMLLTPILLTLLRRWLANAEAADQDANAAPEIGERTKVIVAGFGRFGQIVSRLLIAGGVPITVIDHDPVHLEQAQKLGLGTRYGNALRPGLLQSIGISDATVLVIALDDRDQAVELVEMVKKNFPDMKLAARAWDMPHQWQLMHGGADSVQRETYGSAVLVGEDVLSLLGEDIDNIERISEAFRDHDERLLNNLYEDWLNVEDGRISNRGRDELVQIIKGDLSQAELERKLEEDEDRYG